MLTRRLERATSETTYIFFILLHVPLGLLAAQRSPLLTYHALAILGAGGVWGLFSRRQRSVVLLYWSGYVAGAEVLWRLARARIFWEFGKYATLALIGAYLLRQAFVRRRLPPLSLPLLYVGLLFPSALLTILSSPQVRQDLSFNLSGPLALAVCAWVFSYIRADKQVLERLSVMVVAPTVALASAAAYVMWTRRQYLMFSLSSNVVTSGGFGPNQVSATLGMGVLFAFVLALLARSPRVRVFYLGVTVWLLTQAFLTFSRGGVLNAVVSLVLLASQYIRTPRYRRTALVAAAILLMVGNFFLVPWLNTFTRGAFWARFTDLDMTGRDMIMRGDFRLFEQSPFLGVGPGMAKYLRASFIGRAAAAHTEFTRLLAEHGVLGLFALLLLFKLGRDALERTRGPLARGLVLAFVGWSLAEMFHAAMRIVATSYLFGLSQVRWNLEMPELTSALARKRKHPIWTRFVQIE